MEEFFRYFFHERRDLIERMRDGKLRREDTLVGFTRHTPAIVSVGPAGLNASIKGIGIVHKEEYLAESVEKILAYLEEHPRPLPRTASRFLLEEIYVEEKVDPLKMSTIELAKRHTYANLKGGGEATVLFYTPPETTYEVRTRVHCYEEGLYFQFVNGIHDVFHGRRKRWDLTRPTPRLT